MFNKLKMNFTEGLVDKKGFSKHMISLGSILAFFLLTILYDSNIENASKLIFQIFK